MPKYKAHLSGGFITFFLVVVIANYFNCFRYLSWQQTFTYLTLCLIGSLFPDIDTKSKIQKWIYYPLFLVIIISVLTKNWTLLSFLSIIAIFPMLVNHRGITHRLWFILLAPAIPLLIFHYNAATFPNAFRGYFFFVMGAVSHILLDFGPKRLFR